jgi:SAM-dependent methyltransferase
MSTKEQIAKEFITVPLTPGNMTFYPPRRSILASVKAETASFYGSVLDVGCGFMPYRELIEAVPEVEKYVGLDLEGPTYYASVAPDLRWNGVDIPAEDESFDCIMATEFLEHYAEPEKILKEILRVLKPGGIFFATVPFIWNLHEIPFDEYRYTPYSIDRHLKNAGFQNIEIKALGGWNMALAQMIGLWLGFAPINKAVRVLMKMGLFPFYVILILTDAVPAKFDGHAGSMYNGLSIHARR